MKMKMIYIASDHAGFELKTFLMQNRKDFSWIDLGPTSDARVDYPDFANALVKKIADKDFGVLICGSGQGMAMRANRYPHIRAALCYNLESTKLARQHNDANVLCLGSRMISKEFALTVFDTFIHTPFEGGRHAERVKKLSIPC